MRQRVDSRGKVFDGGTSGGILNGSRSIDKHAWHPLRAFPPWLGNTHRSHFDLPIDISLTFQFRSLHRHTAPAQTRQNPVHLDIQTLDGGGLVLLLLGFTGVFLDPLLQKRLRSLLFPPVELLSDRLTDGAYLSGRELQGKQARKRLSYSLMGQMGRKVTHRFLDSGTAPF